MDTPRRFEIARQVPEVGEDHYALNHLGWGIEFKEAGGPVAVMFNDFSFIQPGMPSEHVWAAPIKIYDCLGAMLAFERCVYRWMDPADGLFADDTGVNVWVTPAMWLAKAEAERAARPEVQARLRAAYGLTRNDA